MEVHVCEAYPASADNSSTRSSWSFTNLLKTSLEGFGFDFLMYKSISDFWLCFLKDNDAVSPTEMPTDPIALSELGLGLYYFFPFTTFRVIANTLL